MEKYFETKVEENSKSFFPVDFTENISACPKYNIERFWMVGWLVSQSKMFDLKKQLIKETNGRLINNENVM